MPRDAAHVPAQAWGDAGQSYLAAIRQRAGAARRLVDKQPFNYMYVGPIQLMLPGSRIVHAVRDPRDTCLSMYCIGFAGVPGFAYDLSDLGEVYRLYWELMEHWREVVPDVFLDVRYESLVAEPEPQIRRLLEHAGVGWDAACLDFHSNARAVSTASRAQVRQPMYRSSIGRWKAYENELAPLLEKLEPVLARMGAA
jgi:hypothetical protein